MKPRLSRREILKYGLLTRVLGPGVAPARNQIEGALANSTICGIGISIASQSDLSSAAPERDLRIDHRTILGIPLGEANLAEVQRQLGEAKLWSDGDAATMEGKVCYVTQGPNPLVLVFASNFEMAGPPEFKLTDVRILGSSAYEEKAKCQSLSVTRDKVGTTSGLKIGISRARVRKILGRPPRTEKSEWAYTWTINRTLPPSDRYYEYWLARKKDCFEGKSPFYTVSSEIIVQFDGDVVVALTFSRMDSIC
jgi:hypothetical protein